MRIKYLMIIFGIIGVLMVPLKVDAETFEEFLSENQNFQERYNDASAEKQERMKKRWTKRQERYNRLSEEQKAEVDARRQARKTKFDSMSEEEKAALKEKMKNRFHQRKNKGAGFQRNRW